MRAVRSTFLFSTLRSSPALSRLKFVFDTLTSAKLITPALLRKLRFFLALLNIILFYFLPSFGVVYLTCDCLWCDIRDTCTFCLTSMLAFVIYLGETLVSSKYFSHFSFPASNKHFL